MDGGHNKREAMMIDELGDPDQESAALRLFDEATSRAIRRMNPHLPAGYAERLREQATPEWRDAQLSGNWGPTTKEKDDEPE